MKVDFPRFIFSASLLLIRHSIRVQLISMALQANQKGTNFCRTHTWSQIGPEGREPLRWDPHLFLRRLPLRDKKACLLPVPFLTDPQVLRIMTSDNSPSANSSGRSGKWSSCGGLMLRPVKLFA
jgi:hypothetical protein